MMSMYSIFWLIPVQGNILRPNLTENAAVLDLNSVKKKIFLKRLISCSNFIALNQGQNFCSLLQCKWEFTQTC
jgi:hypothetical protein